MSIGHIGFDKAVPEVCLQSPTGHFKANFLTGHSKSVPAKKESSKARINSQNGIHVFWYLNTSFGRDRKCH